MIRLLVVGAILVGGEMGFASEAAPEEHAPLQVVLVEKDRMSLVQIRVEVGGHSLPSIWDETFARLFAFCDRNGDGLLDRTEASRLPAPLALRQAMGNGFTPPVGSAPAFARLDSDGNGKVVLAEVAALYRKAGLGNVLIGVSRLPTGAELTSAFLKGIDTDGDGTTTEAEWKAAEGALRRLDTNGDALIGAGELVPRAIYPGAAGTRLLQSPAPGKSTPAVVTELPLLLLPTDRTETFWAKALLQRVDRNGDGMLSPVEAGLPTTVFGRLDQDHNGSLSATELSLWRQQSADTNWVLHVGKDGLKGDSFHFGGKHLHIESWVNRGRLGSAVASAREAMTAQVSSASSRDGLAWLTPFADRDDNGRISSAELNAWLGLQEQITRGLILLTVLDDGGLFELVDTSHDGALSVRELRGAWKRIQEAGCVKDGSFSTAGLPRVVLAAASHGYPSDFGIISTGGPSWFLSMDRNGDGDVALSEFIGSRKQFDALDRDHDGLISPEEAGGLSP